MLVSSAKNKNLKLFEHLWTSWSKNWSLRSTTSNDGFIWYMIAYLRCLRAIFEILGEPFINYSTKAIVIELIKQNVAIDCVEGFFKIREYSTRYQSLIHVCLYIINNFQYCVLGWLPLTKAVLLGIQKFMFLYIARQSVNYFLKY